MSSWLAGGLKSSFSSLKDQVTNSINDVLEEFKEDETDSDLLDESSGRDAETRLFLAVDRLRDVRQSLDDRKKELLEVKDSETKLIKEKKVRKVDFADPKEPRILIFSFKLFRNWSKKKR